MVAEDIIAVVKKHHLYADTEIHLQDLLERCLPVGFKREHWLSQRDKIDFFYEDGRIGVEVKTQGSNASILSQLIRYAMTGAVDSLVLLTTKPLPIIPSHLSANGKVIPLRVFQLVCF